MKDISVVILSHNTAALLEKCLSSVYQNCANFNLEVVVVDNASSDKSVETIQKKFPLVKLVISNKNLGYTKGNNLGVKNALGKYVFLLNSDTEVIGESLGDMLEFMEKNEDIGILGPKLINPDGSFQNSVGNFYSLPYVFFLLSGLEKRGIGRSSPDKFCYCDWISGAAMMIRKSDFEDAGGFCGDLFMYMEEVEFCYRLKLKGIKTAFLPEAKIIHRELGKAANNKQGAILGIYQGLLYFYRQYFPKWQLKVLKIILITKAAVGYFFGVISRNSYLKSTYEQAFRLVK